MRAALDKRGADTRSYPFSLPVVRAFSAFDFRAPVTVFAGENGSGKSTLIEALAVACGFNAEGGSRNFRFKTARTHSDLYRALTITRGARRERGGFFLRAESFYNVATEIERLDSIPSFSSRIGEQYGEKKLHELSHGESFLALVENRFHENGLYILDEPEAALSPTRQLTLLALLHRLVLGGSQVIMATHSPILMGYPGAELCWIDGEGKLELTSYENTEHYAVMREFLTRRDRMLDVLLKTVIPK